MKKIILTLSLLFLAPMTFAATCNLSCGAMISKIKFTRVTANYQEYQSASKECGFQGGYFLGGDHLGCTVYDSAGRDWGYCINAGDHYWYQGSGAGATTSDAYNAAKASCLSQFPNLDCSTFAKMQSVTFSTPVCQD
jgi:hypothetical protein